MRNLTALLLPLVLFLAFSACKKDSDKPGSTVADIKAALVTSPEKFTIANPAIVNTFTTTSGIEFSVPRASLEDQSGNVITSPIEFQVKSMLTVGDMIRNNCPTVGPEGLFISGGEFSISATSNGKPLKINPARGMIQVKVPAPSSLFEPGEFQVWKGNPASTNDAPSAVNWSPVDSLQGDSANTSVTVALQEPMPLSAFYYFFHLTGFYLTNLDIYYPVTKSKTGVDIKLPQGLNDQNSLCYLVVPSPISRSAADLYDFNTATNAFYLGHYQIPVGLEAKAVVISKVGDQYKYGVTSFTVTENAVIDVSPVNTPLEAIKDKLAEL